MAGAGLREAHGASSETDPLTFKVIQTAQRKILGDLDPEGVKR